MARKIQKAPVPYLGGVAIAIGIVVASYSSLLAVDFSMETFRLASYVLIPALAIAAMLIASERITGVISPTKINVSSPNNRYCVIE